MLPQSRFPSSAAKMWSSKPRSFLPQSNGDFKARSWLDTPPGLHVHFENSRRRTTDIIYCGSPIRLKKSMVLSDSYLTPLKYSKSKILRASRPCQGGPLILYAQIHLMPSLSKSTIKYSGHSTAYHHHSPHEKLMMLSSKSSRLPDTPPP